MRVLLKKRVLLLLLLGLMTILFLKSDWLATWMYPVKFKDDIRASASNYGVEPHLVAAIIRSETNYRTGQDSKKGALGLMQIMPDTEERRIGLNANYAGYGEVGRSEGGI
jgi:soluble lytic murein transglycosylase